MSRQLLNETAREMGRRGGITTATRYPDHAPQRLGGKRGAETKLRNDPDYFKKMRAKGVEKQLAKKRDANSSVAQVARLITGEI